MDELRNVEGVVTDVQRFSLQDGPGIRTTVFLKGCPLRCRWCHNPECLSPLPQMRGGAPVGRRARAGEVIDEALRDRAYYGTLGGLTVSGGEPLMQPEFARALLHLAKSAGLNTCVETCGFGAWAALKALAAACDLFLFDWKAGTPERHLALTGAPRQPILDNLERLTEAGARIVLRCPIVPGLNDGDEDLRAIAEVLARHPGIERAELMAYHSMGAGKYRELGMTYELNGLKDLVEPERSAILERLRAMTEREIVWG
jgi:pyruvate formate lyase activating enzyme